MTKQQQQLEIIKKRYSGDEFNVVRGDLDREFMLTRLRMVVEPEFVKNKVVLEIGAGASLFLPIFLDYGCQKLVANEMIEERLKLNKIDDARYLEMPGEFLETPFEEDAFDVVFANLTMMCLTTMFAEIFDKMHRILKPGGVVVTIDSNFLCPKTLHAYFTVNGANPLRPFSPFNYARKARNAGFIVEKLVPFTRDYAWAKGNWLLGSSFAMKAVKRVPSAANCAHSFVE